MTKHSTHPGPRAHDVRPVAKGDDYSYVVDKLWTIVEVRPDGKLVLTTRRGKQRVVEQDDRSLRRPSLWERLIYRSRFPKIGTELEDGPNLARPNKKVT